MHGVIGSIPIVSTKNKNDGNRCRSYFLSKPKGLGDLMLEIYREADEDFFLSFSDSIMR